MEARCTDRTEGGRNTPLDKGRVRRSGPVRKNGPARIKHRGGAPVGVRPPLLGAHASPGVLFSVTPIGVPLPLPFGRREKETKGAPRHRLGGMAELCRIHAQHRFLYFPCINRRNRRSARAGYKFQSRLSLRSSGMTVEIGERQRARGGALAGCLTGKSDILRPPNSRLRGRRRRLRGNAFPL